MTGQENQSVVQGGGTYVALPGRFEEIARRHAGWEAIRSPRSRCSYAELDRQSSRLAGCLCRILGKEPRPVALLLEDKVQVITSLMGVIRAGHFYCALTHKDPAARLVKVLRDLEAPLLVTDRRSLELARQIVPAGCQLLLLSDLPESDRTPLPAALGPDALLGVFYTSGSTGEPKGVLRTHAYVMHRLWVDLQEYGFGPGDRLLFMYRFDVTVSLSNLFNTLLNGATLVLYDADEAGITPLADLIRAEQITIFSPPLEFLRHFLDSLEAGTRFDSIRAWLLSGDVLFRQDLERLSRHVPSNAKIAHFLSSSECGLLARTILSPDRSVESDIIPVGRPVPGREILILDPGGKPVPDGAPGQIAIRSEVEFPGYWGLPELSSRRFLPDPMAPGRRIYCTGDLGYFRPDGELVFLGRNDLRVKIRGFTVDCSSVEGALMTLPQVRRAVVVPVMGQAGHKRLVGCVVLSSGYASTAADLRTALSGHLPDHMVPCRIILLPELPRTPNGKVDRPALQALASTWTETEAPCAPPANPLEGKLVRIWEELLDMSPVGVQSDFFGLGGHSLLAIRMLDKVEQETGVRLPASALLHTATIKELAQAIIASELAQMSEPLIAMRKEGSKPPFYFLHGDYSGCGFYCREMVQHLEPDRPFFVLPTHGLVGELPRTIETMAAKNLEAVLANQKAGPFLLGGYCNGGLIAFEMARQLQQRGLEVGLVLVIDADAMWGTRSQHRVIQMLFRGYGLLRGLNGEERRLLGLRARLEVSSRELAGTWLPLRQIPGWGARVIALFQRMYRINRIRRWLRKEGLRITASQGIADRTSPEYREQYLRIVYRGMVRDYSPGKYRGKVVVLSSSHMKRLFPNDPATGWDRVAAEVETRTIPGNHLTCISEHAGALAENIRYYLQKTDGLTEEVS
jgi:amino acid adenylation domain-containing protein